MSCFRNQKGYVNYLRLVLLHFRKTRSSNWSIRYHVITSQIRKTCCYHSSFKFNCISKIFIILWNNFLVCHQSNLSNCYFLMHNFLLIDVDDASLDHDKKRLFKDHSVYIFCLHYRRALHSSKNLIFFNYHFVLLFIL